VKLHLLAQTPNMNIDSALTIYVGVIAPNSIQYLRTVERLTRMLGEKDEQAKLGGRQIEYLSAAPHLSSAAINHKITCVQNIGILRRKFAIGATQECPHTR